MKTRKDTAQRLCRERQKLLHELSTLSLAIRGSWLTRYSTCSRPGCSCHDGKRHGPRFYVAVNTGKVQRQRYVPNSQASLVRRGIQQYKRMLEIINRVTAINLELMKGGCLDE